VMKGGLVYHERGCTCLEIYKAMYGVMMLMNRAYDNGRDDPRVSGGPFGDMR
jgi:hypothetical protein